MVAKGQCVRDVNPNGTVVREGKGEKSALAMSQRAGYIYAVNLMGALNGCVRADTVPGLTDFNHPHGPKHAFNGWRADGFVHVDADDQ